MDYTCDENFVIDGNPSIVCKGTKFSSKAPKCTGLKVYCFAEH